MPKKLKYTYYFNSIYDIPFDFFSKIAKKVIFADLDNTLVGDEVRKRPLAFDRWYAELNNHDIKLFIISNNRHNERISEFIGDLPIIWYGKAHKQDGIIFDKVIKEHNLKAEDIIIIGDRLLTDIIGANKANLPSILVAPIIKDRNPLIRHLVRPFETIFIRKKEV
jgi:HAD superfamily (subfamily IIIA) phosphatase, TIGR01668